MNYLKAILCALKHNGYLICWLCEIMLKRWEKIFVLLPSAGLHLVFSNYWMQTRIYLIHEALLCVWQGKWEMEFKRTAEILSPVGLHMPSICYSIANTNWRAQSVCKVCFSRMSNVCYIAAISRCIALFSVQGISFRVRNRKTRPRSYNVRWKFDTSIFVANYY